MLSRLVNVQTFKLLFYELTISSKVKTNSYAYLPLRLYKFLYISEIVKKALLSITIEADQKLVDHRKGRDCPSPRITCTDRRMVYNSA